ncbi:apolipo D-like [Brachionus plicatilis]|uniref:Apolipo D-like n=1 Tax=Brachionus plicatilis TaxID=10195 RepID=A0A3M7S453_BRAPC|nr:apolipo D-like [Brachionus plicatilis]
MKISVALTILSVLKYSESFELFQSCINSPVIPDFSLNSFMGKWYQVSCIAPIPMELNFDCITIDYQTKSNNVISLNSTGFVPSTTLSFSINGEATVNDFSKPNLLKAEFFKDTGSDLFKRDYHIWKTDYTQYAVVYSCSSNWLYRSQTVVILSRAKSLSSSVQEELTNFLNEKGIDANKLKPTEQKCNN